MLCPFKILYHYNSFWFQSDRVDFVQLMLDSQLTDEPIDLTMTADENDVNGNVQTETLKEGNGDNDSRSMRKKLTMEVRDSVQGCPSLSES